MDLYNVAEIELTYKKNGITSDRPKITNSEEAYYLLLSQWDANKLDFVEQSKVVLLNRANRVLGLCNISTGGVSGTVVDARLVFATALKANASAIILAHNHPSANLQPSTQDKQITARLMDAGKLLDIQVIDHLIITSEGYYSFVEEMARLKIKRGNNHFLEAQQPF